ncbi:UDP-N-acetylmuramoyl-L-alanine--D-glutamate ligase [Pollutimonas harenae]|uniref:UDP-N-acetylmuramoylalanine--D-glutamate ligase n=1 Tax=Pollutimonas harenae TaxID=657015 RepID=A0A853H2L3_9BURK|nr:UDP-N-acetylmuramoyl-L-alanine--D-glutamate ligase [Pollutimonas harenae]NYT86260.1 UDP-N-acetylmuramoyl-L-alanine--D-glutamate ligase [Pollutimonas harenae]TEA69979.1 UDP-N-acetylmuramoyl-L-alanine--D-glutamate ligase [Pollutimonas harenae]
MNTMSFPSLRVDGLTLILGLGETGLAAALWCARQGARLRVLDTRAEPGGLQALQQALDAGKVDYRLGPNALAEDALQGVHTIVLSPGLSPLQSPVSEFLALAAQHDIDVVGEIELFARALADMAGQGYQPKVLAVTGTNGKTTVTAMTRQLVQAGGHTVKAAGNISPAGLTALSDALEADDLPEVWVLELSSFQLESVHTLRPDAAVVLNVTQDHLDWHGSMQAYAAAKARLLNMSRVAIVNRDDPLVMAMVDKVEAQSVRSFGHDMPVYEGDLGLERSHDMLWLVAAEATDFELPTAPTRRKKAVAEPPRPEGRSTRLIPADALRVRGQHNALNALAALALARSLGLGWAAMLHALRDYAGEAHRTEYVRTVGGVDFINDSKGTNVGAAVAALDGMGAPVVLIAGGLGKGQDFSPLAAAVRAHARAVILIGQDAGLIGQALVETGVPIEQSADLGLAVGRSMELAQPGDTVLLSPACASMDMFRNYGHRGSCFVDEVQELALSRGEVA